MLPSSRDTVYPGRVPCASTLKEVERSASVATTPKPPLERPLTPSASVANSMGEVGAPTWATMNGTIRLIVRHSLFADLQARLAVLGALRRGRGELVQDPLRVREPRTELLICSCRNRGPAALPFLLVLATPPLQEYLLFLVQSTPPLVQNTLRLSNSGFSLCTGTLACK